MNAKSLARIRKYVENAKRRGLDVSAVEEALELCFCLREVESGRELVVGADVTAREFHLAMVDLDSSDVAEVNGMIVYADYE